MDKRDLEIRRSVECREVLLHEVPPNPLLRDFNIVHLTYRAMWVSDTFEIGMEIDGSVDQAELDYVLSKIARVTVMDLREVKACVEKGAPNG